MKLMISESEYILEGFNSLSDFNILVAMKMCEK